MCIKPRLNIWYSKRYNKASAWGIYDVTESSQRLSPLLCCDWHAQLWCSKWKVRWTCRLDQNKHEPRFGGSFSRAKTREADITDSNPNNDNKRLKYIWLVYNSQGNRFLLSQVCLFNCLWHRRRRSILEPEAASKWAARTQNWICYDEQGEEERRK